MALHRGFSSVEEHDAYIADCWNSVVRKGDIIYILGDLTMEKGDYSILASLAGFKKIVLGNHDMPQHIPKMLEHVNSVCSSYKLKGCILTHIPIHESEIGRYRYNIHGHCVDEETEILTIDGWKLYNEINIGDEIYSYNGLNKELELDIIYNIIVHKSYSGKIYSISKKNQKPFIKVTDKHMMPYEGNNGNYMSELALDFFKVTQRKLYKSFLFKNKGVDLSDDLLKLYIYLVADGNTTNNTLCRFNFLKERKIELVEELLQRLGIKYSRNTSKGQTRINFQMPSELYNWKIKGLDKKILNSTRHQAKIIKQSYKDTDGNRDLIFTSKKEEVDILQHMFTLNGFLCKSFSRVHGYGKNLSYQLSVTDRLTEITTNINKKVLEEYVENKLMWCIQCKNKNFIMRRSGSVTLTGNCHEKSLDDSRYINVSCEAVGYTPVLFSSLIPCATP